MRKDGSEEMSFARIMLYILIGYGLGCLFDALFFHRIGEVSMYFVFLLSSLCIIVYIVGKIKERYNVQF